MFQANMVINSKQLTAQEVHLIPVRVRALHTRCRAATAHEKVGRPPKVLGCSCLVRICGARSLLVHFTFHLSRALANDRGFGSRKGREKWRERFALCCAPTPSIVLTFAVDVNDARSTRCARSHLYTTARLLGVSTWNSLVCQDRLGTNAIEQRSRTTCRSFYPATCAEYSPAACLRTPQRCALHPGP